jgi:NADH:ubiquinone reductase (non-electrogenic)
LIGSLAYIGSDKAVADLPFGWAGGNVAAGGQLTYYFWRSAYLSKLFSLRNRTLGINFPHEIKRARELIISGIRLD